MSIWVKGEIRILFIDEARLLDGLIIEQCYREIIAALEKSQEANVLLHFGPVTFMSSAALGMLIRVNKKCKEYEIALKLCNITPDIRPEDLEILENKVNFLERTSIDDLIPEANIKLTIPDGFDRMLEHIAVHRYFMGLDWKRDMSEQEAIRHWYDTVYMPIIRVIRDTDVLSEFPSKTEGDLYLWVLDHQRYLVEEGETCADRDCLVGRQADARVCDRNDPMETTACAS